MSMRACVQWAHIFPNKPHIVEDSLNACFLLFHFLPLVNVCNSIFALF